MIRLRRRHIIRIWIYSWFAIFLFFLISALPYMYCIYREPWRLNGQTLAQFEKTIFLFTKQDITLNYNDPSLESWAIGYKLPPKGKVIRYNIFFTQPLDVVVDDKEAIVQYFTSYE